MTEDKKMVVFAYFGNIRRGGIMNSLRMFKTTNFKMMSVLFMDDTGKCKLPLLNKFAS
jgi:hypothetical protein